MVNYRGISASMISQHSVRKLPEYQPATSTDPFRTNGTAGSERDSIATCYVPSYPGAQVWFDYSVDEPHPPNAQYLFKLLHNGEVFTSWDCTKKYGYRGRTTYGLKYLGDHPQTGHPVVERQAFRFSTEPARDMGRFDMGRIDMGRVDNWVELRVHRIEHRVRIPLEIDSLVPVAGQNIYHDGLQLVNGGILSPNDPKRHYKYQLLDPVDKPYATIRFYYGPRKLLTALGIVPSPNRHSRQNSSASDVSRQTSSSDASRQTSSDAPLKASSSLSGIGSVAEHSPARSEKSAGSGSSRPGSAPTDSVVAWLRHHRLTKYTSVLSPLSFDTLVTLSDEDLAGLGITAQGSRRKLLRELTAYEQAHSQPVENVDKPVSLGLAPPRLPPPKLALPPPKLPPPSSAPACMTSFGPTINEEMGQKLTETESGGKAKIELKRTTRAERGGGILFKILGRRLGRAGINLAE